MKQLHIFLIFFCLFSCNQGKESMLKENSYQSIGVLEFNSECNNEQLRATILNPDNSVYAYLDLGMNVFVDGKTNKHYDLSNNTILDTIRSEYLNVKEFYPDMSVIQFEVLKNSNDTFFIYINREKSITKKIIKNNCLIYKSWQEHLVGAMVEFSSVDNPLRNFPDTSAKRVFTNENIEDNVFVITEVKHDWIRIQCSDICGIPCSNGDKIYGWIRWRKGNITIVSFRYAC